MTLIQTPTGSTSTSLLQATLDGDRHATERVYLIYYPLVLSWCSAFGLQPSDIEDIAQLTLLKAFQNLGSYQPQKGKFRHWLWRIASNLGRDFQRELARVQVVDPDKLQSYSVPPHTAVSSEIPAIVVARVLSLLRENFDGEQFEVLNAVLIQGRSAVDVAKEFGRTRGAVYTLRYRATALIRQSLKDFEF